MATRATLLLLLALLQLPRETEGQAVEGRGLLGGTVTVATKPKRLVYAGPMPQASSAIERECRRGLDS